MDAVEASHIAVDDVAVDVDPDLTLRSDADYLVRILVNLLDNAHKYGTAPVELAATAVPGGVELASATTGPAWGPTSGRACSNASCDPRHRRSGASPGTGLGLAIVQALSETLGGRVVYEDAPDGGAQFLVRLPSAPQRANRAEPAPARPGALPLMEVAR